jgi:ribonuclease BN (tRNA processing enzyme)
MRVLVLGCSGSECPGHNPPGFLLDGWIAFDAGCLTNVLPVRSQRKITHICITHAHLDHVRDIAFLVSNMMLEGRRQKISIMSMQDVLDTLSRHLFNGAVWPDLTKIPSSETALLQYRSLLAEEKVSLNGYSITPIPVTHTVFAVGYLIEDQKGRSLFYTGDTGPTPATWKMLQQCLGDRQLDVLIVEASLPNRLEHLAIRTGHLTASLLHNELQGFKMLPKRIYITHAKPNYLKIITSEIKKLAVPRISMLKDGQIIKM